MEIMDELEEIVGPDRVSNSQAICQSYQFNCFMGKEWKMKPDVVVLVETTNQVSQILKVANQYKIPVRNSWRRRARRPPARRHPA